MAKQMYIFIEDGDPLFVSSSKKIMEQAKGYAENAGWYDSVNVGSIPVITTKAQLYKLLKEMSGE